MILAYLDEAGDTGRLPGVTSAVQPLFCLLALTAPESHLHKLTVEFLDLKHQFFPKLFKTVPTPLGRLLVEIKGSDIRATFRGTDTKKQAHHLKFIDRVLDLVERHNCKIFGKIWIKPIGGAFDGHPVYTASVQEMCGTFHKMLDAADAKGMVIADSRAKALNSGVSFSIFTQRFSTFGNPYPKIIETPVFAHSENHALLQVCDLICSGLVFPIAAYTFCLGHLTNLHVHPGYQVLQERFGARLKRLQFMYTGSHGFRFAGGLSTRDPIGGKRSIDLFYPAKLVATPTSFTVRPRMVAAPPQPPSII